MSTTMSPEPERPPVLIGYPDLLRDYALSKRTVQGLLRRNQFPAQVLIGRGHVSRLDEKTGYTPLKVQYLRKVIPDKVEKHLREHLVQARVIETNGHYVKGKKSIGYRLAETYRGLTRRVLCGDAQVAARVL